MRFTYAEAMTDSSYYLPLAQACEEAGYSSITVADSLACAYDKAFKTDPVSAFGGILAFNRALDAATAEAIVKQFAEVVIAPRVEPEAHPERHAGVEISFVVIKRGNAETSSVSAPDLPEELIRQMNVARPANPAFVDRNLFKLDSACFARA